MEKAMARDGIHTNDRQLACARIQSEEGQNYLSAMACAANYAWVNRSSMTFLCRQVGLGSGGWPTQRAGLPLNTALPAQAFAKMFNSTPDDLDMHVVYDVSHNIAKVEEHVVDGRPMRLLVHRKGATRAFPPHHPLIPVDYQFTGQPVLIGGTMGTCSYVLLGTEKGEFRTVMPLLGRRAARPMPSPFAPCLLQGWRTRLARPAMAPAGPAPATTRGTSWTTARFSQSLRPRASPSGWPVPSS